MLKTLSILFKFRKAVTSRTKENIFKIIIRENGRDDKVNI
jgi:hypothetical protein